VPRTVYVTPAQRDAAKLLLERSRLTGRPVSPAVLRIADAELQPSGAEAPERREISRALAEAHASEAEAPAAEAEDDAAEAEAHAADHWVARSRSPSRRHLVVSTDPQELTESDASAYRRPATVVATQPVADEVGPLWTKVNVSGVEYLRLPLHTRWLDETDDLTIALKENLRLAQPGDTVALSEKVAILLTGRTVDINTVQPGRLARFLASHVHPRTDSKGLRVPERMEYVVRTVGHTRILAASVGFAVTRPLGMHGTFYRIAGPVARDVDGARPPYEHVLFPPLDTKVAQQISVELERVLGIGVSIVDLNDYGGTIRAVSPRSLSAETLAAVLADNPLGQRLTSTPFVLIRPA
jgi:hypothetical protein